MNPADASQRPHSRRSFVLVVLGSGLLACSGGGEGDASPDGGEAGGPSRDSGGGSGGQPSTGGGGPGGARDSGAPPEDAAMPVECSDAAGTVTISRNHGHHLLVPREHLERGVDQTYDLQGVSAHPHQVTLTAADFEALGRGEAVTVTSSVDQSHDHEVVVGCF